MNRSEHGSGKKPVETEGPEDDEQSVRGVLTGEALRMVGEEGRALLDSVPAMIWYKDTQNRILRVNRMAAEASGLSREALEGHNASEFYPEEAQAYHQDDLEVITSGLAKRNILEVVRVSSGEKHWVRTDKFPFRDESGKVAGVIVFSQDIDEQKRAEEKLHQLTLELRRSNRDLEQFAHIVSHDLSEPLRMISSFLGLLAQRLDGKLTVEEQEFVNFALDGAKRLRGLIESLLEFSRVDTRFRGFEPVNMGEVVQHALKSLKRAATAAGAIVCLGELPRVLGDETQLAQLFHQLLDNAIKFRRPGTPVRVSVSAVLEGDAWHFIVEDNGVGMEMRHAERSFLIFQRLCAPEDFPGRGVGLALSKRIVERHGGRIWVISEPDRGSEFHFTLPQRSE